MAKKHSEKTGSGKKVYGLWMDDQERGELTTLAQRLGKSKSAAVRHIVHAAVGVFQPQEVHLGNQT